jgi:hypothetical protein
MNTNRGALIVGGGLVILGLLFLLQNFGFLGGLEGLVWVVLFGLGGLIFLYVFATNREQWWAVIPGFTLLGLAALIGLGDRLGALGGALFLGAIGLSFWVIYFVRRDFWWAVIPGGVLMTLAAVAALSDLLPDRAAGGIFFLGLAATFFLVYLLPTTDGRMKWALIPAGVLAVLGVLVFLSLGGIFNYLWALLLIAAGVYLLTRSMRVRGQ